MEKRTVGKPRFYAPLDQYLKAKGYYRGARTGNMTEFIQGEEVWNMNPTQPSKYILNEGGTGHHFDFYINTEPLDSQSEQVLTTPNSNKELQMLLSKSPEASDLSKSGFYLSALGHKITSTPGLEFKCQYFGTDGESLTFVSKAVNTDDDHIGNVNTPSLSHSVQYNGYSISHFNGWEDNEPLAYNIFRANFINESGNNNSEEFYMGAISWGRWFEPERSVDLDVKLITSYEGIEEQTTVGGSSLSNINYLGNPNWGNLPPWTLEKQQGNDYNIGASSPRRAWKIKLSYLSDTNIFSSATNQNKFFTWTDPQEETGGEPEYKFDASMASFMGLTFNGALPFLFNPDSNADNKEFAICKIDAKSISYTQVAHRTWNLEFTVKEVW